MRSVRGAALPPEINSVYSESPTPVRHRAAHSPKAASRLQVEVHSFALAAAREANIRGDWHERPVQLGRNLDGEVLEAAPVIVRPVVGQPQFGDGLPSLQIKDYPLPVPVLWTATLKRAVFRAEAI